MPKSARNALIDRLPGARTQRARVSQAMRQEPTDRAQRAHTQRARILQAAGKELTGSMPSNSEYSWGTTQPTRYVSIHVSF